jgi:hypothetical protein
MLCALFAAPAHGYIADDRWTSTATDGFITSSNARGVPATVTWSLAPDGTNIGASSNLIAFLDGRWGSASGPLSNRPWFTYFEQSFNRFNEISGVNFVYEPNDDGVKFSQVYSSLGVVGKRGDIRLGGKSYGAGSSTLASNYYPDYGDMMVNTDQGNFFGNSANNYRALRNTLMHEIMHGLGIIHVSSTGSYILIEPTLTTVIDGPQLDDVLAVQRLYGDFYEKNGGNDLATRATPLGAISPTQSRSIGTLGNNTVVTTVQKDFVSIDDESDTDFYSFSLAQTLDVTLDLIPQGATYSVGATENSETTFNSKALSNLTLALFDVNGTTILETANATGLGGSESIERQLAAGTYFARVTGSNDNVQLYKLAIAGEALPPTVVFDAADFNEDGHVDGADLLRWQQNVGPSNALADADGDHDSDGADFLLWQRQVTGATTTAAGEPVPEPASWLLLLTAGFGAWRRRRVGSTASH